MYIKEAQEVVQINRVKVEQGVTLCKKTAGQLEAIEKASQEILNSAEHILRASEEQNQGIQQINQAIQMISQSTQENASAAEECSGSSQSLTEQGLKLKDTIDDLEVLVYGETNKTSKSNSTSTPSISKPQKMKRNSKKIVDTENKVLSFKTNSEKVSRSSGSLEEGNVALKIHNNTDDPWEKL